MKKGIFIITTVDGYGADSSMLENIIVLKKMKLISPFVIILNNGAIEKKIIENEIEYCVIKFNTFIKGENMLNYPMFKRNIKVAINKILAAYFFLYSKRYFKKVDLVYTNTLTTFFGIYIAKMFKCKHVMHIREIPFEQFQFEYEFGEKRTLDYINKFSDKIVCNSEYTLQYFSNSFDNEKLVFVPNPIYNNQDYIAVKDIKEKDIILFVLAGRYEDSKNQFDVLIAIKSLVKNGVKGFILDLYGDGPLKQDYIRFVKSNNLGAFVRINNFESEFKNILPKYHVGIVSSRYEAFGRVTAEYMFNGLAVIGNETGNTPYLIDQEKTGLIYKFKDPNDLASKIRYLLDNKALISEMGRKGQKKIGLTYSIENSSMLLFNSLKKIL